MADSARALLDRLRDARSRRVVLVSHCLLNENTRYAGGASRPGAVIELVDELMSTGAGIHQLPCPEQRAWGGVLKRWTLPAYGSRLPRFVRRPLLRLFVWHTRRVYRRLARRAARDVADYVRAGMSVEAFVGVGASPSCGVVTTLDLGRSLDVVAACPLARLDRRIMNEEAVLGCARAGEGLFVAELRRALRRRGLDVPMREHDLAAELR